LLHATLAQRCGGQFRSAFPEDLIAAPLGQELQGCPGLALRQGQVLHPESIELLLLLGWGLIAVEDQGLGQALIPELGVLREIQAAAENDP